jgi:protein-L-isoaspartate(D-aspartate) O-methyltransferase
MPAWNDTYKHKGLRKKLIDSLAEKGIDDKNVLTAMHAVPRHFFLDGAFEYIAYEDRAFPIAAGQTISQPYTVAYQSQLLQIKPFDKILEIGTGSGYQAAVLAQCGAQVFTIERQKKLFDLIGVSYLKEKYASIKFFYGDGFLGKPTFAPFDKILITAAAPFIPQALIDQLSIGGILVAPVGEGESQIMTKLVKQANGENQITEYANFSFVPMLAGKN